MGYIPDFEVDCPSRYSSSVHESAHACTALALKTPVWAIEVASDGGGHYYPSERAENPQAPERSWAEICQALRWEPSDPSMFHHCVINFAGAAAQQRLQHGNTLEGCGSDFRGVEEMLSAVRCNPLQHQTVRRMAIDQASKLVDQHWTCITVLARRLYHLRRLEWEHIKGVLRRSRAGRKLLGEQEPSPPLPLLDAELVYSKPLNKYAVLWRSGAIQFFDTHEAAKRAASWENDELRYRDAMLTAA